MEWLMMSMDHFFTPTIQLGAYVGENKYLLTPNCHGRIDEVLERLHQDKERWHYRRSLFLNNIIAKRGTFLTLVLQELMTPVECLMPSEIKSCSNEGHLIIYELESSIVMAKKLFLDTQVTKSIIDVMSSVLQDSKMLSLSECELINHCLLLVRNLLHVSNIPSAHHTMSYSSPPAAAAKPQGGPVSAILMEDQILWNLFAQRFDNILIRLLTCNQQHLFNVTMVQLMSLMYREQQQGTIRNLINEWLTSSLSESSEDDENNPMSSSSSDDISTSDPVSDSSERLSPMDGIGKANKIHDKTTEINENSDTSAGTGNVDKDNSSKDSGFGRSGSNVDSSPDEWPSLYINQTYRSKNKQSKNSTERKLWCAEDTVHQISFEDSVQTLKDSQDGKIYEIKTCLEMENHKKILLDTQTIKECKGRGSVKHVGGQSACDDGRELGSSSLVVLEKISPILLLDNETEESSPLQFIHNTLDDSLNTVGSLLINDNDDEPFSFQCCVMNDVLTPMEESGQQPTCLSQEIFKRPPNEEESGSSGDWSEKKPPPQLPKLHKNKPILGQKRSRHTMSQKMLSNTQENIESSNSTGSECDEGPHAKRPHHHKPHKMLSKPRPAKMLQKALQERNFKRSKLIKRKESKRIKAKALLHHHPTAEDISNLLKEFTVDFVLNGYSNLLQGLRLQVMLPCQIDLDKSHVLWLITYFLRFAVELDLELSQICPVLSIDVVSYLVYEGVVMQEDLERAVRDDQENLLPHVRRLHLVVTALREFFIAFDVCMKKDQSLLDVGHLMHIKEELGQLVEVRQLFVLLIRMYRPGVLSLNYLQDLITTNHLFLTTQEVSSLSLSSKQTFDILNHIRQFATMDMMRQYGRLLENFNINDETVNDCIFTMMHHIAGDLRNVNVMLQPAILRVFLRIWQEGCELCVDWADLIEYVLRKCTRVRMEHPKKKEKKDMQKPVLHHAGIELTNEDLDQLYNLYSASTTEQDLMDKIKEICCDDCIEEPIKKEVIQKLLARGFITTSECSKLCAEIPTVETLVNKCVGDVNLEDDVMMVSSYLEDCMDDLHTLKVFKKKDPDKGRNPSNLNDKHTESNMNHLQKQGETVTLENKDFCGHGQALWAATVCDKAAGSMEGNVMNMENTSDWDDNATVIFLTAKLKEEGYGSQVMWLQTQLLEACYAKIKFMGPDMPRPEPVALNFAFSNQSIPIIPWTGEQEEVFSSPTFLQLLRELGFHLPSDTGKLYPRMPHFWCPNTLFIAAKRLGPLPTDYLKVSVEQIQEMMQFVPSAAHTNALTPLNIEDEDSSVIKETSSLDCDDSFERVSDCSMENNRSSPSTPASLLDEKLSLGHDEDVTKSHLPSQRIPVAGLMVSPAGFQAVSQMNVS
nr:protein timeless-like [Procambarus clarkii]